MSSSSLKNKIPKRTYKERAQLSWRKRLGPLEKHKDYVKRARLYHRKQDKLQFLQIQAELRNPDEFNPAMGDYLPLEEGKGLKVKQVGSQVKDSQVKKIYQRDLGVLHMNHTRLGKKIKKLQTKVSEIASPIAAASASNSNSNSNSNSSSNSKNTPNHTVFVEDEQELIHFNPVKYFETPHQLASRRHNRPRVSQLLESTEPLTPIDPKQSQKALNAAKKELQKLKHRNMLVKRAIDSIHNKKTIVGKEKGSFKPKWNPDSTLAAVKFRQERNK